MTRHEVGLMLLVLVLSVAGALSWRLFRPNRGEHVYGLTPVPIPRLEYGSMILEEETRLRGENWQDAYIRALAPETLDEENERYERPEPRGSDPGSVRPLPDVSAGEHGHGDDAGDGSDSRHPDDAAEVAPALAADLADETPDPLSLMSDDDFWNMTRFEFRRLEWLASEPLTLPAWTGRAA